ncbi:CAMK family protein kinase [Trichomonas vaginalis G3]|uniref:CAMK family protein kinase n=1 Tax=Trichomonas vaginalis (strain ATCC PRA-98 / G3) TaxID=412133 RepID=A2FHK6_TRIV3|nr:protein serine/threonine kinase protein [Trichomonas vaginalis G3]EAX95597.1 CAMK family protein kinase [Trichomonas vaginalis G3]KAI5511919.1 protein serine/threonine kinase protein [Trichomonas vaginalis G3]|eukprot:XP_001308527.1 CAMK family protein kinase [Trichomonas vaginalis G3]
MNITTESQFLESIGVMYQDLITHLSRGVIYQVYSPNYKMSFALKTIPEDMLSESELRCLEAIDDPNIVSLYQIYKFQGFSYLMMEYCPKDLDTLLKEKRSIRGEELCNMLFNVTRCVRACHDNGIAHCDIKPSNFLVDKYNRVKINDFSKSVILTDPPLTSQREGTKLYQAPEIFSEKEYNPVKADIWSLGVLMFYMTTNTYPFQADDPYTTIEKIQSGIYNENKISDPQLRFVIRKCLDIDPNSRPDALDLLQMPYFMNAITKSTDKIGNNSARAHNLIVKPKIQKGKINISLQNQAALITNKANKIHINCITK